jgi:GT2 family glycosyltransferase
MSPRHDLAIIVVSTNEAKWLRPCLTTIFEHAGDASVDVVVVDNESTDGTRELVESFSGARVVDSANHGFAHANNRGLMTTDARYVLFLNPDTEILHGTFGDLVAAMDSRPDVGLAGVKQVTADGELFPTIRRFPSARRAFAEALACERFNLPLGERELRMDLYERELACDWTSGSFMLARREALESAGYMDERFFIYAEEPDLCWRMKRAGWDVRHLPQMTILHHADKAGVNPKMTAQDVYARMQYARKHFPPLRRALYGGAIALRHGIRATLPDQRSVAARRALRVLTGREGPPFGQPPRQAVAPRRPV